LFVTLPIEGKKRIKPLVEAEAPAVRSFESEALNLSLAELRAVVLVKDEWRADCSDAAHACVHTTIKLDKPKFGMGIKEQC
jgi:hypothetical protein